MVCSFRILKKAGELRLRQFVFVFIAAKIIQKTHCNFQISKDCDHRNIKIVELDILYQILCDDCSGTFTFKMPLSLILTRPNTDQGVPQIEAFMYQDLFVAL